MTTGLGACVAQNRPATVPVPFDDREFYAVVALAERELRSLPDQVRMIVQERLCQDGLLKSECAPGQCQ
jgi:hypothetical protein